MNKNWDGEEPVKVGMMVKASVTSAEILYIHESGACLVKISSGPAAGDLRIWPLKDINPILDKYRKAAEAYATLKNQGITTEFCKENARIIREMEGLGLLKVEE